MDTTTKIRDLLRSITGTDRPTFDFRLMEVISVDGDLCRAKIGDFEIPDIRLSSVGGGSENGLLVVPAVGSVILVADISCGTLRELNAIGYSEIDSIRFHKGKTTVEANAEGVNATVGGSTIHVEDGMIRLGGESNGGLVKAEEVRQTFRSFQTYCQTMKAAIATGIAAVGVGAAADGVAGAAAFEEAMSSAAVRVENMENEKVTH